MPLFRQLKPTPMPSSGLRKVAGGRCKANLGLRYDNVEQNPNTATQFFHMTLE